MAAGDFTDVRGKSICGIRHPTLTAGHSVDMGIHSSQSGISGPAGWWWSQNSRRKLSISLSHPGTTNRGKPSGTTPEACLAADDAAHNSDKIATINARDGSMAGGLVLVGIQIFSVRIANQA